VENPDTWKPVTIAPGDRTAYLFTYDYAFFAIRHGERLRIAISVWPQGASIQDWKAATTVYTPVFASPSIPGIP
jgi:hypothetical protein